MYSEGKQNGWNVTGFIICLTKHNNYVDRKGWMQCGIYAYVYSKTESSISQKHCIYEKPIHWIYFSLNCSTEFTDLIFEGKEYTKEFLNISLLCFGTYSKSLEVDLKLGFAFYHTNEIHSLIHRSQCEEGDH